jgi:hypothetical protein
MTPTSAKFHPTILKACLCTAPVFCLMWVLGAGPLALFVIPPESAANSAATTVLSYTHHLTRVELGCFFMIISSSIYCAWLVVITLYTREAEGHRPALFWIQMISIACCEVVVMLIGFFWGVAAFRAGHTNPQITQALNDVGWFGVLFTGAPFFAYQIALAASIFLDRSESPAFPRWYAYVNLFVSVFMFEAALILFFKHGAFSQNGLFVFWMPMIAFFTWILLTSAMGFRAVNREKAALAAADAVPDMGTPLAPSAGSQQREPVSA